MKDTEGNINEASPNVKVNLSVLNLAQNLPTKSGCYLFKNKKGEVIYVGKAKNLKSRVTSYFKGNQASIKTDVLVRHIEDLNFFITENESEALVLENNLIKKYSPKYNIQLKDDKTYPYVIVNLDHPYPKLEYVRRPKRDSQLNRLIFGPYVSGSNIYEVLSILNKAFKLRVCTDQQIISRKEPCLLYQLKQCTAPCMKDFISEKEYKNILNNVLKFLEGDYEGGVNYLTEKMQILADREEFEHAAILRDYLKTLDTFSNKFQQKNVDLYGQENSDIIAYYIGEEEIDISIYLIRKGVLLGQKTFYFLREDSFAAIEEMISSLVIKYYLNNEDILPDNLVFYLNDEYVDDFKNMVPKVFGKEINFINAKNGMEPKYQSLYQLTWQHAMELQRMRVAQENSVFVGLNRLKELLKLKERPKVIECYDIAIWQGKSPCASKVVSVDGKLDKKNYRYYHLQERAEGNNDFAMMKEVIERRLQDTKSPYPDLILVDGGMIQVNAAVAVLKEMNINIAVAGIAKARGKSDKEERLMIPGRVNPYFLKKCPPLFRVATKLRDEAHRFSRKLHHKTEKKRIFNL